jgi:class 3 adenylate cyclase/tetratricopeptide (TPR) repeat protein
MEELRTSINGLEAQRDVLGDAIVNPALKTLRGQLAILEEQAAAQALPVEDRRMVTILFTDIVGSTAMAEKLDPEEWRRIVAKTHQVVGDAITAHHGRIAQYLGDGLLAFFGVKEAGENDPENAIRAALEAQAAVTNLLSEEQVKVRVGIHTGLVVVGELGAEAHKEFTASGDAMNLAARLQSAAPPGGVLVSHDTYRYVRGVFDVTPRPPLTVKGKSEPVQTYLVRRAKPRPFRTVARGVAGVEIRTIGRETETQTLQNAYLRAYEGLLRGSGGHGLVWAQLLGEPGVGKSRLLQDMDDWLELREETFRLLRARAFPDDASQPFALVRRMWFERFQIAEDAPLEQAEAKWVERFKEFSGQDNYEEPAHALGLLVGLPFKDSPHIGAMRNDPAQVKGRALVVSQELLRAMRAQDPVVLLLEDMQWIDPASWEYLMEAFLGGTAIGPNGLFILGAARSDWQPPRELSGLIQASSTKDEGSEKWAAAIQVRPLSDADTRLLVQEILKRVVDVPEQVIKLLVERSEGIPYYVEEMVNWFIDNAILDTRAEQWRFFPEKLKEQPLPATLQHLLLTRLSTLSQPERSALQRGAIFGRRFWTGGVEALGVSGGAETLGHLQPRGFVEAQPESAFQGETEWNFHQNLLQEVTYESVLKRERAALHKVAVEWLEKQALQADRLDEFTGLLGEHCERAGELNAAADWYLKAGRRAMAQGAPSQAVAFYTRALELLPPVDRDRRWLVLLGREEALTVLSEAERRKVDIAALLELAGSSGDDDRLAEAYFRQAYFGSQIADQAMVDQALPQALASARRAGNQSIEARALTLFAILTATRADIPATSQYAEEALQLARRLEDESVLSFVLQRAAWAFGEIGDFTRNVPLLFEQIELDHRLGNRLQEASGLGNLGANYLGHGMFKQARALLEQARVVNQAMGARRTLAYNLGNLGDVCLETGDLRKAQQFFEEALLEVAPSQDDQARYWLLNDLGIVLLVMGDAPGAARHITEALQTARGKGWEQQTCEATIGLAACALALGQLDEARTYVHEAWDFLKEHGWFGLGNSGKAYRMCMDTFDALAETEKVTEVLEIAHQILVKYANKINEPEWRKSFLENMPDNRALMEMWERMKLDKI